MDELWETRPAPDDGATATHASPLTTLPCRAGEDTLSPVEAAGIGPLSGTRLAELMARAAAKRDTAWGRTLTYSRKVFIPLTTLCRDTCGYCTFVKQPGEAGAHVMSPDEVLTVAEQGRAAGAKEALFSLGERPERKYAMAREALARLGHDTMVGYLGAMARLVFERTGLIPHLNPGTLTAAEFRALRPFAGSMGMMVESTSRALTRPGGAHHACPDKVPLQRLRTLDRAGAARVPFTTGLLIGIGESWADRVDTLAAIAAAHAAHGHVQEVIVQNFRAKPGIAMADRPEPPLEDMLATLAVARLMLPAEISVQAPPNLGDAHGAYIDAGLNDWGGISPVTIDHINPERAWPQIDRLAGTCAAYGYALAERLTVYPRYLAEAKRWIDPGLAPAILAEARTDGLARRQIDTAEPSGNPPPNQTERP